MQQKLSNPKLKWWQGILLILGIVLLFMAMNLLGAVTAMMIGGDTAYSVASVAYWVFGGIAALMLVRAFIMDYLYTLEGLTFRVDRIYGRMKPRLATSVVTRSIIAYGTVEEITGKFEGIHHDAYTRNRSGIGVRAFAYESGGAVKIMHIQPNEALDARLIEIVKENRK